MSDPTEITISPAAIEATILERLRAATPDQIIQINNAIKVCRTNLAEVSKLYEAILIERIEEFGDIELPNGVRLYVGHSPKYVPHNPTGLYGDVLAVFGGDLEAMSEQAMASGWYKPGAIRQRCVENGTPEAFDLLFKTEKPASLEEGAVKKKLLESNTFTNRRKPAKKGATGKNTTALKTT